jgi:hypothetical protein
MRIMRTILACFGVVVFLGLTTQLARAGQVNCTGALACTSLITSFGGPTPVATDAGSLVAGGVHASYTENVYYSSGIYTYEFTITNLAGGDFLSDAKVTSNPGTDNFDSADDYGVIGTLTTGSFAHVGFGFSFSSLTVCFDVKTTGCGESLGAGTFTFYAQSSLGPRGGIIGVSDSTTSTSADLGPGYAPEPSVLTLLGSLVFALLLGSPLARTMRHRMGVSEV